MFSRLFPCLCLAAFVASSGSAEPAPLGTTRDGQTDDTIAIQKALDKAGQNPGSTVLLPKGRYRIDGTLHVPAQTTLQGEYWGPGRRTGTVLLATGGKGKTDGPGCVVLRDGIAALRNIAIEYPDQSPDAEEPIPYPYAISGGHSARVEEVFLFNAYQGINFDAAHAGMIRNVWGEPLRVGIHVDHCYDVCRIENVHFWPYFTHSGRRLRAWVQHNGVAFEFGRSDWQYCLNSFSYGYHTGVRFLRTEAVEEKNYAAGTTNAQFIGFGVDSTIIAVDVEDSFSIGVSFTNSMFGPFAAIDTRAILLHETNTGNLTFTNCNFWAVTSALAEVRAGSLALNACNIQEWGLHVKENPCFLVSGGRLNVSGSTFNQGGALAKLSGEATLASFTNLMGSGPLTIENGIGERCVVGTNNPKITVETQP